MSAARTSARRPALRLVPTLAADPASQGDALLDAARRVLDRAHHGALATVTESGAPFGSIVRFACDEASAPLFALREGADHELNLRGDGRASLLVTDPAAASAPFAGVRVTVVGVARKVEGDAAHAARAALGASRELTVYRLDPQRLRVATPERSGWLDLHRD